MARKKKFNNMTNEEQRAYAVQMIEWHSMLADQWKSISRQLQSSKNFTVRVEEREDELLLKTEA